MLRKDYKLFFSLMLWMLIPSVYLAIRMNIVTINNVDINILGQMEWFDLIDEIIVTTLTVPLYYLLKPGKSSPERNGIAFLVSFGIYILFTIIIASTVGSIATFMEAPYASQYLLLQSFAMLVSFVGTFMIMLFTLNDDYKTIGILLLAKIGILIITDLIFISKFADIGASYSDILANSLISIVALLISYKRGYIHLGRCDKSWVKDWIKIGIPAGGQIFLDNFIYAIMICKMVNAVADSGNYWVSNNFIWGWLLVPVLCMSEIIKKNNLEKLTFRNTWMYGLAVVAFWCLTSFGWPWFVENIMACDPVSIMKIVYPSVVFYISYIGCSFIDSWFVSKGKTHYNMLNSVIVNIVYYGMVYILFRNGVFEQNLNFVIGMFGFGMIVHLIISIACYVYESKKTTSNQIHK